MYLKPPLERDIAGRALATTVGERLTLPGIPRFNYFDHITGGKSTPRQHHDAVATSPPTLEAENRGPADFVKQPSCEIQPIRAGFFVR